MKYPVVHGDKTPAGSFNLRTEEYVLIRGLCRRVSTSIDRVPCRVAVLVVAVHVHPVVEVPLVATDGGGSIGKLAQNCPKFCLLLVDAKY